MSIETAAADAASPEPASPETAQITEALTRLRRFLRLRVRTEFPWETLPMAQVEFLQRLAEEPRLRISELAQKHQMATNTVSTVIQQLVVKGLVVREPDPSDRRAVVVSLTPEGERDLAAWMGANELLIARALLRLDEEDRAAIAAATPALKRLSDALDRL